MSNRAGPTADVLRGTLDPMVLQTRDSPRLLHGYAIAARLEYGSSGALRLNMGTPCPALTRLDQRDLLHRTWGAIEIIHTVLRGEA